MTARDRATCRLVGGHRPPLQTSHRFGWISTAGGQPRITLSIKPRIIRVEVDKATLNQKISNFEDIAPAARVRHAGAPRAIAMNAGACTLAGENVRTAHDPVEGRVVVQDAFDQSTKISEQLPDLFFACGKPPFGKENLSIFRKQIEHASPTRG